MNLPRKIYCRIFQKIMRAALIVLPYRNPELLYGFKDIPRVIYRHGLSHPLIVTDPRVARLDAARNLFRTLGTAGLAISVYSDVRPNPTDANVMAALSIYRFDGCDSIIALGGGSPMDCAKAVGASLARPHAKLSSLAGILKIRKKTPLTIAIPTTAGTGSETTLACVIVDSHTRHKYVINDFPLIPDYAVMDPSLLSTLPGIVEASTGMDALTHAVEAYIGGSTNKLTRHASRRAVRLIFANIENAVMNKNPEAEKAMLVASHYAGRAFTRSYVGYVHAVSHSLSGRYDMPHGLTNAVILPIVLEMYGARVYPKLAELAVEAGLSRLDEDDEELAKRFIDSIYELNRKFGIPERLEGIMEEDIDELSGYADHEANPLYPVPVLMDREELKKIYRKIMA